MLVKNDAGEWVNFYAHPGDSVHPTVIEHGSDNTVSRPSSAVQVLWIGSVAPDNPNSNDIWFNTSNYTTHVYDGSSWNQQVDQNHRDNTSNPHSVTASQAGAVDLGGDTMTGLLTIDGSGVHPDLGFDFAVNSDAPNNYPSGYTTFNDAQGSFPAGGNGVVETINPLGGNNVRQLNWDSNLNHIFARVSVDDTTWGAWFVNGHSARIVLSSDQTLSNNTNTKLNLGNVDYDYGGIADTANNQIVLDHDGIWSILAQVTFDTNQNGARRIARILRGGTNKARVNLPPSGGFCGIPIGVTVNASSGASVELAAEQDTGGDLIVQAAQNYTFLSVAYLGPGT